MRHRKKPFRPGTPTSSRGSTCRRAGVAPIEFVLVLPLILFLCAGLFLMARATVGKEAAATQARRQAWANRPQANPGEIFRWNHAPSDSQVQARVQVPIQAGTLFRSIGFQAESRSAVMDLSWAHRQVPFGILGVWKVHEEPLRLILKNLTLADALVGMVRLTADLLNPQWNPVLLAAAAVGRVLNVIVQLAGKILVTLIRPVLAVVKTIIQIAMIPLRIAAIFSRSARRLLRRLENALRLIDLAMDACTQLDRAARGLPVRDPYGLERLFVP